MLGQDPLSRLDPFNEDTTPLIMGPICNHRWIYASAKQLLERVLHAHGLQNKLDYTIIRPFNFVGPEIDYLPSEQAGNPRVFSHFMNGATRIHASCSRVAVGCQELQLPAWHTAQSKAHSSAVPAPLDAALLYGTEMKLVDGGSNLRGYTYSTNDAPLCIVVPAIHRSATKPPVPDGCILFRAASHHTR